MNSKRVKKLVNAHVLGKVLGSFNSIYMRSNDIFVIFTRVICSIHVQAQSKIFLSKITFETEIIPSKLIQRKKQ